MLKRFFQKLFQLNDHHEFKPVLTEIEHRPVSPLGRLMFWLVVALVIITLLWLCIGEMDVVVSARGKVIPNGQVKVLQPLETGVVRQILVAEGQVVQKGQPLIEIDPSTTEPQLTSYQKDYDYLKLEENRLEATVSGKRFAEPTAVKVDPTSLAAQQRLYLASNQALQEKLAAQQDQLKRIQAQLRGNLAEQSQQKSLLQSAKEREARLKPVLDIIPKDEYQKVLDELTTIQTKLISLEQEAQGFHQQQVGIRDEMAALKQGFQTEQLKELTDRQKQLNTLAAKIEETTFRNQRQILRAPASGTIDRVFIHTVGGVVTPAQKLLTLVPAHIPLRIEAQIANRDIGFIRTGMKSTIKVETYDFQKYGMLPGKVIQISKDSHEENKQGLTYIVHVKPLKTHLLVEGAYRPLQPGMATTTEIHVGKRRIIEFFIYPLIKYWHDGLSVR